MNNKEFKKWLKEHDACEDGYAWVGERDLQQTWNECERGDWLLWLYTNLYPDNVRERVLVAGYYANTVRHLMKDKRSRDAVDTAIAYGEGKINIDVLTEKRKAAYYAAYAYDAYAYAYADYAPAADAAYAAYAAYASAAYAADATARTAKTKNQKQTADICRKYLTI